MSARYWTLRRVRSTMAKPAGAAQIASALKERDEKIAALQARVAVLEEANP